MIKVAFINKFFEIFPRNFKLIFAYHTYNDDMYMTFVVSEYIHK